MVAPLAGSVDRNLSAGGAGGLRCVAPLAGSVDRNFRVISPTATLSGRSPRGERG